MKLALKLLNQSPLSLRYSQIKTPTSTAKLMRFTDSKNHLLLKKNNQTPHLT